MFSIVVAYDSEYGIGKNGRLPWKCPTDMKFFSELTTGNIVIMGRKTYESIGSKPLPNRLNVVVSNSMESSATGVMVVRDIESCCKLCSRFPDKKYYVIGGADIYKMFLKSRLVSEAYVTEMKGSYECNVFFPDHLTQSTRKVEHIKKIEDEDCSGMIIKYTYPNLEEHAFLSLGRMILNVGVERQDRTGTGTVSLFGQRLEFNLAHGTFPLLTTRKMFLRGIFEELMLYIRGQTDNNILVKKGINVWTPNTTRQFLDSKGLQHLPVGDMGPSYGFLFRHFGAKYIDCYTDYTDRGVDQLARVIDLIKNHPDDRRMIISLWDPMNIDKCPLPPCLYNYQFHVAYGVLSCMMTQRSSDFAIAGGWNIATGALLTIMLAKVCDLQPGKLTWNLGDVHIYRNLIDEFEKQLERSPYAFPKLYINKKDNPALGALQTIEQFEFSDLNLLGYKHHEALSFTMSV